MPSRIPTEFRMEDVVLLRKPHPCGGSEWKITRLGADIGLLCSGCGRHIMLERRHLERRLKSFVSRGEPADPAKERLVYGEDDTAP